MKDWVRAGRERDAVRMAHPLAELPNGRVVDEADITTWTSHEWLQYGCALLALLVLFIGAASMLWLMS